LVHFFYSINIPAKAAAFVQVERAPDFAVPLTTALPYNKGDAILWRGLPRAGLRIFGQFSNSLTPSK
jgi:hypothetical protein